MINSSNPSRQLLNHLMQVHGNQDSLPAQKFRPQALRFITKLENNKSSIAFDVKNAVSIEGSKINQVLLTTNDVFVVSHLGFMIEKVRIQDGKRKFGNARALPYPDRAVFNGAPVAPSLFSEAECLEAIYNGLLSFKTGDYTRLGDFPMSYFRITPETQQSATTEPSLPGQVVRETVLNYYMSGTQSHKIEVAYPEAVDVSQLEGSDAEFENYLVCYAYGVLIVDGAQSPELLQIATPAQK